MRTMILLLAVLLLGYPLSGTPHRQANRTWKPAGFGGAGNFNAVYFDPAQPGVVYAASDVAGVLRSTDHGDHWEIRSSGLGNYEIDSFAVDPFDSNTLYAGVGALAQSEKAGIDVSHDAGKTWQHLASTFTNRITFRRYRTATVIAPDPTKRGILLSGSRDNGIWRSTDGGLSWEQVYKPVPTRASPLQPGGPLDDDPTTVPYSAPVSIIIFDPTDPRIVYAGLSGAGVVKSTASGVAGSWQAINQGLPSQPMIKYVTAGRGVLYAAVGTTGVYKRVGDGSWLPVNGSLPLQGPWVSSVAVHPTDPAIAYLTLVTYDHPSVWKTVDGGLTWAPTGEVAYDTVNDPTRTWTPWPSLSWQVVLDPANPERLFYVDYWGIYRSDDGGDHWQEKIVGAQNTCVNNLLLDTDQQPYTLYATHWDAGLLSSQDNGVTWKAVMPPPDPEQHSLGGHYWGLAITHSGNTKYYFTTADQWEQGYSQVFRSTDGVAWKSVFKPKRPTGTWRGGAMVGLAADPHQPATLYVAQDGGRVFKSTDNGNNWSPTRGQPGGASFTQALAVDSAGRVFIGTLNEGLWRSVDGGASWRNVLREQSTIFGLLAVPDAIYVSAGDSNLYRSVDGGNSWENLTRFEAKADGDGVGEQGWAIAVDPGNPRHLFFSRLESWHQTDAGYGIVESIDGGKTWSPLDAGLAFPKVSALVASPDGSLFAGTACAGIWRLAAN